MLRWNRIEFILLYLFYFKFLQAKKDTWFHNFSILTSISLIYLCFTSIFYIFLHSSLILFQINLLFISIYSTLYYINHSYLIPTFLLLFRYLIITITCTSFFSYLFYPFLFKFSLFSFLFSPLFFLIFSLIFLFPSITSLSYLVFHPPL